jgi:hypothetical protein
MAEDEPHSRAGTLPRRPQALLVALGLLLVAIMVIERLACLAHAAPTDFDDAYTYLRYAQHWLAGDGIAWNAGEPSSYGVTSLLHLLVVTAIRWAFPTLAMWRVLHIASGAAAVGLLAALVATLALEARSRPLSRNWVFWTGALLPLLAFRDAFVFQAGTGMDTMLAALANAVFIFFTLQLGRTRSAGHIALVVAAGAMSVLARPDNLLCAALCPALAIALLGPGPRKKPLVLYVVMGGLAFGGLAVTAWLCLGTPVPLSFFVKQPGYYAGFAGEFGWNPFRFLQVFLLSVWPFVVLTMLLVGRRSWRTCVVLLVPALSTIVVMFRFNQIMGHLGRFYYPMLPFFVVAGALELDGLLCEPRRRLQPGRLLVRCALVLGVVVVARIGLGLAADRYDAHAGAQALPPVGGYHVKATESLPELDSWESARRIAAIAEKASVGTSFAMSEHGLPGALAPQVSIIDVLGLHDREIAHRGFDAAELFRRRPDFIWMPHGDHVAMLRDILASDELWAHYAFYPDAFFYGVAVRSDGIHSARLDSLLSSAWAMTYPGFAMGDYRAVRGE